MSDGTAVQTNGNMAQSSGIKSLVIFAVAVLFIGDGT